MYHRFEENKYPSTNIKISDFKKQLEIIQKSNIKFINPKDFKEELINNKKQRVIYEGSLNEVTNFLQEFKP